MLQHLTALSKDHEMAPYVNLVKTDLPGDIYSFVAEKVWDRLEYEEAQLPSIVYDRFEEIYNGLRKLQEEYNKAPRGSELKAQAWEAVQTYRNNHRTLRELLFPVYWRGVTDLKERRKIVKRPCMTWAYGATVHGFGQQIWDDSRDISPYLAGQEKLWSSQLGRLIFEIGRKELKGPGGLLTLFETIAGRFNDKQENLAWTTPITNFPVVQNYKKPISDRTLLKHGDDQLKVVIENWDSAVLDKESQKLGASPNIVHSLDATHLMLILYNCGFDIAPIHDAYGCVAGDMSELFRKTRETFVQLYEEDPLKMILEEIGCEDMMPERGTLDVREILDSDFAFC